MHDNVRLGLSAVYPCNYLADQQERLVFTMPEQPLSETMYRWLTDYNFRRSGEQLYRPYCEHCQACVAVRLDYAEFAPSANQRRVVNRAKQQQWHWRWNQTPDVSDYYPLYHAYICQRHADGVMYPPAPEHLQQLLECQWLKVSALEQYVGDELVGVMILDPLGDGFSAVYSFYQPEHHLSLGTLAVLAGVELCRQQQLPYLYLGYWVEGSKTMDYKARFRPQQRLIGQEWLSFR